MKSRRNRNLAIGIACASSIVSEISAEACRYCQAAKRDERNQFPFTAAMEWRKAAELAESLPLLADICWREWERIMQLPRRLAQPIGMASVVQVCQTPRPVMVKKFRAKDFIAAEPMPMAA
jgi:hypothetical protein